MQRNQRDHDEYVNGEYDERKNSQLSALARAGRDALHANVVQGKSRHKKPPGDCTSIAWSKFSLGEEKLDKSKWAPFRRFREEVLPSRLGNSSSITKWAMSSRREVAFRRRELAEGIGSKSASRTASNLRCFGESHGDGVHAIAEACRTWAVIEGVAEMCVTETTGNLGAHHS
jgi:hypothetical protein